MIMCAARDFAGALEHKENLVMSYKVAVVGATGNVGREMLNVLSERVFPVSEVVALASSSSIGKAVSFGDKTLKVKGLEHYDFKGTDIVLMSAGGKVSKEWSPKIAAQGALVIDNSSAWRMDRDVPLVVPEVNADALHEIKKGIIANPNCSTIQLVVALKPLHDVATIKRVIVATYQSVSGTGKDAMDELFTQTRAVFVTDPVVSNIYPKRIAFNVIPQGGDFLDSGYTTEEFKMMVETQKILDPNIQLTVTVVRVPVFIGHSEAVHIEFEKPHHRRERTQKSSVPRPAFLLSISARMAATLRRWKPPARMRPMCRVSAKIPRSITGWRCGWCPTICARVPRSTRCRSPKYSLTVSC